MNGYLPNFGFCKLFSTTQEGCGTSKRSTKPSRVGLTCTTHQLFLIILEVLCLDIYKTHSTYSK